MLSKNVFFVCQFFFFFFFLLFLCRGFQLKRQTHYFKTFRVLKSINGEVSLLRFWAEPKGQKPLLVDADTQREHRWVLFLVSSSTECISWWKEGIWEEELLNDKTVIITFGQWSWGLQTRWPEPEGCADFSGSRVRCPFLLLLSFLGPSYMEKS